MSYVSDATQYISIKAFLHKDMWLNVCGLV